MQLHSLVTHFIASRALFASARTMEWYHYNLDPLCADPLGQRPICEISSADLTAWLASRAPGRSRRTLQGFYTALSTLFNFALEQHYLPISPMKTVKKPKVNARVPDYFSDAQLRALLMACGNRRDRAILLTFLDTGLRREELLSLNVEDLDFDEGFLLVREGKGDKDRYVPFGLRCASSLKELLLDHPNEGALLRNRSGKRLETGGLRSMLLRLRKQAGLDCRVHPHKFRHTFARNYLKQGGDLETLREILGHEDIRITSNTYARFLREGLKERHRRCSPVDNGNWEQSELVWGAPEI